MAVFRCEINLVYYCDAENKKDAAGFAREAFSDNFDSLTDVEVSSLIIAVPEKEWLT